MVRNLPITVEEIEPLAMIKCQSGNVTYVTHFSLFICLSRVEGVKEEADRHIRFSVLDQLSSQHPAGCKLSFLRQNWLLIGQMKLYSCFIGG